MSTTLAPGLQSLPPPLELRDADLVIGWIDGDVVRFRGFDSQRTAAQAAVVAHQAMQRRLSRGSRGTPSADESDLAAVRRANDHARAHASGRPVASVLRHIVEGRRGADANEFAFEVRVPPPIDELRMRGLAYVMYRALRSSGVAWPLVHAEHLSDGIGALTARTESVVRSEAANESAPNALHGIRRFLEGASGAWRVRTSVPIPLTHHSNRGRIMFEHLYPNQTALPPPTSARSTDDRHRPRRERAPAKLVVLTVVLAALVIVSALAVIATLPAAVVAPTAILLLGGLIAASLAVRARESLTRRGAASRAQRGRRRDTTVMARSFLSA